MKLFLRELDTNIYASDVLPHTHGLWGGVRDLARYIDDNTVLATTTWGRKHFRTIGLYDEAQLVASHKIYEREIVHDTLHLKSIGIGAVFTPLALRSRGYASVMLAQTLDAARNRGEDAAFLFSDIAPSFYESLGFVALPSRAITIRADMIATRRTVRTIEPNDATAVRECFKSRDDERISHFLRTPAWWQWMQLRLSQGSEHPRGAGVALMIGTKSRVEGYVIGVRIPSRDAFILDECGVAPESDPEILPTLLRSAAGDLHRIAGWLPPNPIRSLLPRGAVHRRKSATFMVAALSRAGHSWVDALRIRDSGDPVWASDHI